MTSSGRPAQLLALVVAVLAAPVALAGCGETVVGTQKIQEQLASTREKETGKKVTSVSCPSGVKVERGNEFECTIVIKGGEEETAKLKIRDKEADMSLVEVTPVKKGR